jgi:hypothetical protein
MEDLHDYGLWPYHIQKVQQLLPGDNFSCIQFCRWLEGQLQLMNYSLFTVEAQLQHDSITSTRDMQSWLHSNPCEVVQIHSKCMVWNGRQSSLWYTFHQGMFGSCFLQTFCGKCSTSNKMMTMCTMLWNHSTFWQRGYRVLACKLSRKLVRTRWTQQLLEHLNKATAAMKNKMEMHQTIRRSLEKHLIACILS